MKIMVTLLVLFAAAPAWCADDFALITGLKGTVSLKRVNGKLMSLSRDKHLLRVVRSGEAIETGADGWVKLAALEGNRLFELSPGTGVLVQDGALKTVKGRVASRSGFPVPTRVGDRAIGAVVLGSTLRGVATECLEQVRPFNTAVVADLKRISWWDACSGEQQGVSVSLADPAGKVVFKSDARENSVDIPGLTLKPGVRYSVTLAAPESRLQGFVRVLDREQLEELERRRVASRGADQEGRLEFLLYLLASELYLEARDEAAALQAEFPGNDYLKGLARHLNAAW
jgi:hypothetical protein